MVFIAVSENPAIVADPEVRDVDVTASVRLGIPCSPG
jgi:hypothetical protein